MHCTELFFNNEQCPVLSIASQDVVCYYSVYPEEFYNQSTDKICQYALVFCLVIIVDLQDMPINEDVNKLLLQTHRVINVKS